MAARFARTPAGIRFADGPMDAVVDLVFEEDELTPEGDVILAFIPHPQRRDESLLRDRNRPIFAHALLPFFLLVQKLPSPRRVAA